MYWNGTSTGSWSAAQFDVRRSNRPIHDYRWRM